jgi:hypothetical protein
VAGLGSPRGRAVRLLGAGTTSFPLAVLAGALPGAALVVLSALFAESTVMLVAGIVGGLLLLGIGVVLGLIAGVLRSLGRSVPANGFGLCSGLASGERPALTPWLTGVLDDLAGRPEAEDPLTFGELDREGIRLELMTTNLTNRRPHKLPWETREFFFDPDEFRRLFPERVVAWMEAHPPPAPETPAARRDWELRCALLSPLRPLPAKEHLPVIVATRMSLSFPVLLSAVPLWSIDASRVPNQNALAAWRTWAREHPDEPLDGGPAERPQAERCWFSDGGISSNFPVHFFDAPLPRRPTFAINLRPFHPDHPRSQNEADNIYLPAGSGGGLLEWWYRFPERGGLAQLSAFAQSVVRTMQNRVDEAQMRVPGYRDRVVHVSFTKDEGGMNLSMPTDVIVALTSRGQHAAAALVDRFAKPPAAPGDLSWDSHRWTRFRSAVGALAELTTLFDEGYSAPPEQQGDRTYAELSARSEDDHPRAYQWSNRAQRRLGEDVVAEIHSAARVQAAASPTTLEEGAPRPRPEVRLAPRD